MINPYTNPNLTDSDVQLADEPVNIAWTFWGYGVILPTLLIGYGVYCIVTQNALFPYDDSSWFGHHAQYIHLQGRSAICMGIACLSGGLFLVSRTVLSSYRRTYLVGIVIDYVSLLVCIVSMIGIIIWFFFDMFR